MRRLQQMLFTLAISMMLGSCVTSKDSISDKSFEIQRGMTKEEAGRILGKPDFRRFDGDLEQWEYQNGGGIYRQYLIVEFKDDVVKSMDSYNEISRGSSVGNLNSHKVSLSVVGSVEDNEFDEVYNEVKNSVFKESTLERSIRNKKFSCAQCLQLMSLYTFDDDKLKMLKVLKGHIADTINYDDIVNSLDFISSKDKAREILGISK
ncbi:DUF4476 domain-containing protein [Phocaeicola sp.]